MMIWFMSLEFMPLDFGYDMMLLSPRYPSGVVYPFSQPGELKGKLP
jgi:hypothetical protein